MNLQRPSTAAVRWSTSCTHTQTHTHTLSQCVGRWWKWLQSKAGWMKSRKMKCSTHRFVPPSRRPRHLDTGWEDTASQWAPSRSVVKKLSHYTQSGGYLQAANRSQRITILEDSDPTRRWATIYYEQLDTGQQGLRGLQKVTTLPDDLAWHEKKGNDLDLVGGAWREAEPRVQRESERAKKGSQTSSTWSDGTTAHPGTPSCACAGALLTPTTMHTHTHTHTSLTLTSCEIKSFEWNSLAGTFNPFRMLCLWNSPLKETNKTEDVGTLSKTSSIKERNRDGFMSGLL